MKNIFNILVLIPTLFFAVSCEQGIDPITKVDPGPDGAAPVIIVKTPAQGYEIKVPELVSPVNISFEVTDDIELGNISVKFNGTELKNYSPADYKDYRRFLDQVTYDNVGFGNHTITITASDLTGKTSTKNVAFSKVSPYSPKYNNEVFYMPFEGDFMEMISFKDAAKVGNPTFAADGLQNSKAYKGATDSYLKFPIDAFKKNEFTIGLWVKVNATPDRSGILTVGASANSRNEGFRLFREGSGTQQRIKLNVGMGTGESWNDGDVVDPRTGEWVHIAFTVTATENTIYLNGAPVRTSTMSCPISWAGCSEIVIGSGGPTFSYWDHKSDLSKYDEIRIFNKALTVEEIQKIISDDSPYLPKYSGEIFYMSFEGSYKDMVTNIVANKIGTPDFATCKKGKAYAGAADSYLTFPAVRLKNNAFSAVFWTKINAVPDRAGILVMGPEDPANPTAQNNRKSGFRFFRENNGGKQIFKLNAGNGTADTWFDGGAAATVDPAPGNWVHMAFTISATECVFYINGEVAKQGSFGGISWDGCDLLTIMSGAPRFTGWSHFSDLSLMDELRIFNKALTQAEVRIIMNNEK